MEVNSATESQPRRHWPRLLLGALVGTVIGLILAFCTRYLPDTAFSSGSKADGDDYFVVKLWGRVLHEETHPKGTLYQAGGAGGTDAALGPTPTLRNLERAWMFRAFTVFCGTGALLGVVATLLVGVVAPKRKGAG